MPMSGPAYMHASITTPGLTANQHTGNGWDHLRMVERPDAYIIFPSWSSNDYSLSCVIQQMNYTQVLNFDILDVLCKCIANYFTIEMGRKWGRRLVFFLEF